jgi:KaiC/GvpD/RAD55 family RecA-like ATPase
MSRLLTTNVSQAFWCTHDARSPFQPAAVPRKNNGKDTISWFDELFEGGIELPEELAHGHRALTLLVTGPPGGGKSTLAMELCYRLAKEHALSSLYITSETDDQWMIEKARSFGWKDVDRVFVPQQRTRAPIPLVTIWKTTDFETYLQCKEELSKPLQAILESLGKLLPIDPKPAVKVTEEYFDHVKMRHRIRVQEPKVLVIDSLNTVDASKRPELFNKFLGIASSGPQLLVIIAESGSSPGAVEFWEYVSDVVIRLDRHSVSDYMVRTIEVVKARQQPHVWGVHQLKIYAPVAVDDKELGELRRAHPYRGEGGIFIFPSIHYYLSVYKRSQPKDPPRHVKTPIAELNTILKGGLPRGRCTGFIGCRGGHKSHLGYLHLLSRLIGAKGEKGIVVSLRDDEGTARQTMNKILLQELNYTGSLEDLESEDRLEILFYPPGYITAEEFFHRMYISIKRLKCGKSKPSITLLFNSLDQLSSRFPLCARQQIFIPGIIEMLTAEEVTSLFIAVEEQGQPPEQYGLLSMADALLSFSQQRFKGSTYCGHVREALRTRNIDAATLQAAEEALGTHRQAVVLRVIRFAGGQAAGAGGILELMDESAIPFPLYGKEGLHFIPFSPKYPELDTA